MTNTDSNQNTVVWNEINWRNVEKSVFKLQKKIYQASIDNDVRKIRKLQKTLLNSFHAKLLAVRKVSQDNKGKKTAGIDGIKSIKPNQRCLLAQTLRLNDKSSPVRRVWIPKSNGKKRPLGIPVMKERAKQALFKLAFEPEWESRFESNSHGFRPGRSCHDAIEAIFNGIKFKSKFVLDADISQCFDRIDHTKLLEKLNTFPKARRQVKAWLKSGIFYQGNTTFPTEGTPQGGICSPLLANIALHGMELRIKELAATWKGTKKDNISSVSLIRYADDFVILNENLNNLLNCKEVIREWLSHYGLKLNEEKTKIVHTLYEYNGQKPGFNFLGFNIRQFPVGKYKTGKNPRKQPLGFKTIIKPSKEKVQEHYNKISKIIDSHKAAPQQALICKLNPVIKGWSNYYRTCCSKVDYSKLDHLLHLKLRRWADRRHPTKSKTWVSNKYWRTVGNNRWRFGCNANEELFLLYQHTETKITRHTKVKGQCTPYDGNSIYWGTRMGKHPDIKPSIAKLLKRQRGKCNWCNLHFGLKDNIEIDHITPLKAGGSKSYDNLQALHIHCHDEKTKNDLKAIKAYKFRKGWEKVHKRFNSQFDKLNWQWIDDLPTLV